MLEEMSEEDIKHVNTTEVALLLKSIVSKFIEKEIYHDGLNIKSYYKESKHLSVLGTLNLIPVFCILVANTIYFDSYLERYQLHKYHKKLH